MLQRIPRALLSDKIASSPWPFITGAKARLATLWLTLWLHGTAHAIPEIETGIQALEVQRYREAYAIFAAMATRDDADAPAQYYLGTLLEQGMGVAPDFSQALDGYLKSAKAGFVPAQLRLSELYEEGRHLTRDLEQAQYWYTQARNNKDVTLKCTRDNPQGIRRCKVITFSEQLMHIMRSAERGNAQDQYSLSVMYHEGLEVEKNETERVYWLEQSADQGNEPAQGELAWVLATSKNDELRDGLRALRISKRLSLKYPNNFQTWLTLAAAHAELGRFAQAVGYFETAKEAYKHPALPEQYLRQLRAYEAGRPWRE